MVTHTQNWCSAFNPSKCTHTVVSSEHTHCEHAPGAVGSHCSSARGAIGGSVHCSRAPQSWCWRWRECCSFTIPTFNPCRTWDSNPQPLDFKSDSLTIRPLLWRLFWRHPFPAVVSKWCNAKFLKICSQWRNKLTYILDGLRVGFHLQQLIFLLLSIFIHLTFCPSVTEVDGLGRTFWLTWCWIKWPKVKTTKADYQISVGVQ